MDVVGSEPPREDELEVSIFGTGRGESLVLHLGDGIWGVIDACRDPESNDAVALAYLTRLGVEMRAVAFIAATHWHDDHIEGLAETLGACPQAELIISAALTGREFRAATLATRSVEVSALEEMRACYKVLETRSVRREQVANPVLEEKRFWRNEDETISLTAIAPTNLAYQRAQYDIARILLPDAQRRRRIGRMTPNLASVAIVLQTPVASLLLGGDVVERDAGGSGWSAIVAQQRTVGRARSDVYKVPHHGSSGAELDDIWTELLETDPISVLTPFASSRLPRRDDLQRLLARSRAVYLSGDGAEHQAAIEPRVARAAAADGVNITTSGRTGHVRLRINLSARAPDWRIATAGAARQITHKHLEVNPLPVASHSRRRRRRR